MPRRESSPTEPGLPIGLQIDQRRQRPFVAIRLLARCFATALSPTKRASPPPPKTLKPSQSCFR